MVAAGKLFESIFHVKYQTAVILGGVVIVIYTFLGGFLAVCWTDLFQGMLMLVAIIIVPILAYFHVGEIHVIKQSMALKDISASLIPQGSNIPLLVIISALAWGLGYFGQPHILTRFMSVKSIGKLRESMTIGIIWVFISLIGAVAVGFVGIALFDNLADGEEEKVFIYMIDKLFNPWTSGIMLAAILSAIMSTIDSQLLVSSSALTEDFYQKVIKKEASEREVVMVGRICVIIISVIALLLALRPNDTILGIVAYAWGGFGAAFGPLVLFSLFSRKTTWISALAGMVTGTVVLVIWKQTGLGSWLYEIVPGFVANTLTIIIINTVLTQKNEAILRKYAQVKKYVEC